MIVKQVFMIIVSIILMFSLALMVWGIIGAIYFGIFVNTNEIAISLERLGVGMVTFLFTALLASGINEVFYGR